MMVLGGENDIDIVVNSNMGNVLQVYGECNVSDIVANRKEVLGHFVVLWGILGNQRY